MSTKYCGYCGKVLKVNLTDRSVSEYPFSDKDREKYLGGKIMAAKIIADHIKGKIDPLSEENVIVVTTGPLNALARRARQGSTRRRFRRLRGIIRRQTVAVTSACR